MTQYIQEGFYIFRWKTVWHLRTILSTRMHRPSQFIKRCPMDLYKTRKRSDHIPLIMTHGRCQTKTPLDILWTTIHSLYQRMSDPNYQLLVTVTRPNSTFPIIYVLTVVNLQARHTQSILSTRKQLQNHPMRHLATRRRLRSRSLFNHRHFLRLFIL